MISRWLRRWCGSLKKEALRLKNEKCSKDVYSVALCRLSRNKAHAKTKMRILCGAAKGRRPNQHTALFAV
jgi:hypothetical protein